MGERLSHYRELGAKISDDKKNFKKQNSSLVLWRRNHTPSFKTIEETTKGNRGRLNYIKINDPV